MPATLGPETALGMPVTGVAALVWKLVGGGLLASGLAGALVVSAFRRRRVVIALAVALTVAIAVYGMPVSQSLLSASEGATFGFFPILWVVINAIWVYNLTVASGHFDVLRRSFEKVSPDQRIQAIIIAFCFGGLMEARWSKVRTVVVPPGTPIVSFKPADRSLLVPGASVSLTAQEIDGQPTAQRISTGRNGFALPY